MTIFAKGLLQGSAATGEHWLRRETIEESKAKYEAMRLVMGWTIHEKHVADFLEKEAKKHQILSNAIVLGSIFIYIVLITFCWYLFS